MTARVVAIAVVLAGCRQIFGLHEIKTRDAADDASAQLPDAAYKDAPYPDAPPGFYRVGGNVSGLTGTGLVLRDNGADDLPRSANGAFQFATPIQSGKTFDVTVGAQPSGQTCTVALGTGTIGNADVTSVAVTCTGSGGPDLGIGCGTSVWCNPSTQYCCNQNQTNLQCRDQSAACTNPFACDDTADCSSMTGTICCATLTPDGTLVTGSACDVQANCGGKTHMMLCNPNVDHCPMGPAGPLQCVPLTTLAGVPPSYSGCQ